MCLILDASVSGLFMQKQASMLPIWNWLEKKGRIVYADDQTFKQEWLLNRKRSDTYQLWQDLLTANKIKRISKTKMRDGNADLKKLLKKKNYQLQSNDRHIIVAALASKAKLLATKDIPLEKDFKRLIDSGSIYKNERHSHLLDKHPCP